MQIKLAIAQTPEWILKEVDELKKIEAQGLLFYKDQILLNGGHPFFSLQNVPKEIWHSAIKYHLGELENGLENIFEPENAPIYALELSDKDLNSQFFSDFSVSKILLKLLLEEDNELDKLIFRARQLLNWHKTTFFCSVCAGKTHFHATENAKICEQCKRIIYPTTSPAVLVLVYHKDKILLARSPSFRKGVYSVLAGFVEAGESAEQTLIREVYEEVKIKVKNIQYFGSQSWPFDNSFMMGFFAEYDSGEIVLCPNEIEEALWFNRDNLPMLPYKSSLSTKLIEAYLNNYSFK